jgi:hypothetical protein
LTGLFGVTSYTGGSPFLSFDGSYMTVGWKFAVANNYQPNVTHLGFYDAGANGLNNNHMVGLWASDGTLLASVTVTTNSPLVGDFRYEQLATPVTLPGFASYMIGADLPVSPSDNYISTVSNLVMGSGLAFVGAARSASGAGFVFPDTITSSSGGRFGPNFRYETNILS